MSVFYKAQRVGKRGKPFVMLKFKTLRDGVGSYAHEREYIPFGRFMRKWKIDEFPQAFNVLRGDIAIFGPRPRDPKEVDLYPEDIRKKLLSVKPGMLGLAGIFFMDEEQMLKLSIDPNEDYFKKILPIKLALDMFYIDHKCWLLNLSIVWMAIKARILNK